MSPHSVLGLTLKQLSTINDMEFYQRYLDKVAKLTEQSTDKVKLNKELYQLTTAFRQLDTRSRRLDFIEATRLATFHKNQDTLTPNTLTSLFSAKVKTTCESILITTTSGTFAKLSVHDARRLMVYYHSYIGDYNTKNQKELSSDLLCQFDHYPSNSEKFSAFKASYFYQHLSAEEKQLYGDHHSPSKIFLLQFDTEEDVTKFFEQVERKNIVLKGSTDRIKQDFAMQLGNATQGLRAKL